MEQEQDRTHATPSMNDRQRQRLLDRIERGSGTVGGAIPEEIEVQRETIDLNEFVFECKRLEEVPEDERERIENMVLALKRERLQRKQRIEREDLTFEEAERLVRSIEGLDRAINALEGLDEPGIEEQMRRQKVESARRLRSLADIYGGLKDSGFWKGR